MRKALLAVLLLSAVPALGFAATPASAAESAQARVRLGDLDLGPAAGEREARARIHRAAVRLCNRLGNPARADDRAVMADCVHEAQTVAMTHLERLKVLRAAITRP